MSRWDAHLRLMFAAREQHTRLIGREHFGPLAFQKVLYPEGKKVAHGLIIHPPGGVAGGDQLTLDFSLMENAHVLLTTPGATKWYKGAGRSASQLVQISQQGDSVLEWLPQENIVFDQSDVAMTTQVALDEQSVFSNWEIICLGRQASGESWQSGRFKQELSIERNKRLIWHDSTVLTPDSHVMDALAGLRQQTVFGNLVIAAGSVPEDVVTACREVSVPSQALYGVSALPEIFTARYIGSCAQEARQYFETLWTHLRPWYGKLAANRPRIWAT